MIIFRPKYPAKTSTMESTQKKIVEMKKDGIIVIPYDYELVYSNEETDVKDKPFGFTSAIGFEVDDPELEEEEDE